MRVTLVGTHYLPYVGGIEVHMQGLARALSARGVEVTIACLADGRTTESDDGIPVRRVPSVGVGGLRWPSALAPAGDADVVHFHGFSRPLLLRTVMDVKRRVPLVITPHGGLHGAFLDTNPVRRGIKAVADRTLATEWLRRAARIISLHRHEAEDLGRRFRVPRDVISILPNPVPEESLVATNGDVASNGRLLAMGREARIKRIEDLIATLSEHPDLPDLDIVGQRDDASAALRTLARDLPPGRVRFLGLATGSRKIELIRTATALVLCSDWEEQSTVGLEAIAQETPVVASEPSAMGLPTGAALTFPLGDRATLAERIRALRDPASLERLRSAARVARSSMLTPAAHAERVLALYREVA